MAHTISSYFPPPSLFEKRLVIGILASLVTSCATTPQIIYRDRPVEVKVPVVQPCVVGIRPAAPVPLNKQYTADQWKALDPKQKAAIVSRHALELKTYGENINGATIGCSLSVQEPQRSSLPSGTELSKFPAQT